MHFSEILRGAAILDGRDEYEKRLSASVVVADAPENLKPERQQKVLIFEDNEINREVLTRQLTLLNYDVQAAENGEQGLKKWRSMPFDIVLTDCFMPVMDGFELAREIRKAEKKDGKPRTPVIAITANALTGENDRCYAAGMDDVLSKPIELKALSEALAPYAQDELAQGATAELFG